MGRSRSWPWLAMARPSRWRRLPGPGWSAAECGSRRRPPPATRVPPLRQPELQLALIRSHAAGMGPPVDEEVVRATMLLRARTLSMGLSGVRPAVAEALIAWLNAKLTPIVPRHGSVGCSGDLAPLAHIALALVGEGEVVDAAGVTRPALAALKAAKVKPLKLETKEGLSLINGTDGMLGMLALACFDAERCFRVADITAAMSAEALMGTDRTFQRQLHEIRPHAGQVASAANLMQMLRGSGIVASHRHSQHAVQDSYSVRCSPQVAGAARDTLGGGGRGARHAGVRPARRHDRAFVGRRQPRGAGE